MSNVSSKSILQKLRNSNNLRGFLSNFLLDTNAGQKAFLYNEEAPRVINISFNESTCMFSCKMCPYHEEGVRDMYRKASIMSFDTFKALVSSVPNDAHYSFDISAIGETLQFKELVEFIAYAKAEKPKVNTIISTNGLLLNERVMEGLINSGLDNLQISLFAADKEDHEFITGSKSYDKVCKNIKAAWQVKSRLQSQKPFIQTFMMEAKETEHKVEKFLETWGQYVDEAFSRPLYNVGREIEGLTPNHEKTVPVDRYPCITPWYSTAVRSNGDVLACYMFHWHLESKDQVVGNINDNTLQEIWASETFKKFRESHLSLDFESYPICKTCDLWDAYTNIWSKSPNGHFTYSRTQLSDYFSISRQHRGG